MVGTKNSISAVMCVTIMQVSYGISFECMKFQCNWNLLEVYVNRNKSMISYLFGGSMFWLCEKYIVDVSCTFSVY